MAGQTTKKNQHMPNSNALDEAHDLMMSIIHTRKPGNELLQNCDLPPPKKLFSKCDNKTVIIDVRRNIMGSLTTEKREESVVEDDHMGLMKALRLSQTRAREAEDKCAAMGKEFESLMVAFVEESIKVFGYKCVLRLLEFQVLQSRQQQQQQQLQKTGRHCCDDCDCLNWMTALALCLGVAGFGFGFGFAIGFKYLHFLTFN